MTYAPWASWCFCGSLITHVIDNTGTSSSSSFFTVFLLPLLIGIAKVEEDELFRLCCCCKKEGGWGGEGELEELVEIGIESSSESRIGEGEGIIGGRGGVVSIPLVVVGIESGCVA